jgi:conjugal transfer pilus assembly protein TraE
VNEVIREHTLRALKVQRNIFLAMMFFLLLLCLLLSLLIFRKAERIVVIPAVVEKEFWVEGSSVSPSYLEQMACFVGELLLTRSPASSNTQLAILMRHTDPAFSPLLKEKLAAELAKLAKDNASYVFFRTQVTVDPEHLSVALQGDRALLLGDKILSTVKESYRLGFKNWGGRLLLASIEKEKN